MPPKFRNSKNTTMKGVISTLVSVQRDSTLHLHDLYDLCGFYMNFTAKNVQDKFMNTITYNYSTEILFITYWSKLDL